MKKPIHICLTCIVGISILFLGCNSSDVKRPTPAEDAEVAQVEEAVVSTPTPTPTPLSIAEVFMLLPEEFTPELSIAARDLLLAQGEYILPGSDSLETVMYSYDSQSDDHLRLEFSFLTGQAGFFAIELRTFEKKDGGQVAVWSKFGGARWVHEQHSLSVFDVADGAMTANANYGLPEVLTVEAFLKTTEAESGQTMEVNTSYDLNPEASNSIAYLVHPMHEAVQALLATEVIRYVWNGTDFQRLDP